MYKKLSLLGILLALSLALSYIDGIISASIPLPGVKLGLGNIGILMLLSVSRYKSALSLSLARVLLASLLFAGFSGFIMSLAGALLSLTAMAVCNKTGVFGIVATSAAGGIFHNIGAACGRHAAFGNGSNILLSSPSAPARPYMRAFNRGYGLLRA